MTSPVSSSAMPLSAMMALEDLGVRPGQWMIQNAATGAVGKTLAMIAKARGVHVVNVVRRSAGVAELAALGIGNAVSSAEAGWQKRVGAMTGGARSSPRSIRSAARKADSCCTCSAKAASS